MQGNPESRLDPTTTLDIVVATNPATADIKVISSKTETPTRSIFAKNTQDMQMKTQDEQNKSLQPSTPVHSWVMGCGLEAKPQRTKVCPSPFVGK